MQYFAPVYYCQRLFLLYSFYFWMYIDDPSIWTSQRIGVLCVSASLAHILRCFTSYGGLPSSLKILYLIFDVVFALLSLVLTVLYLLKRYKISMVRRLTSLEVGMILNLIGCILLFAGVWVCVATTYFGKPILYITGQVLTVQLTLYVLCITMFSFVYLYLVKSDMVSVEVS